MPRRTTRWFLMPDSVGGVDAILGRLRDKAWGTRRPEYFKYGDGTVGGHSIPCDAVPFADAEVAVHAAADARTQETLALREVLYDHAAPTIHRSAWLEGIAHAFNEIARRFPNGGTAEANDDSAGA